MRVLELGFSCNNACIFCAQGELRSSEAGRTEVGREASLADSVEEQLKEIVAGEIVAFAGGEPTLAERLPEWIRAAHDRGARSILVQTNGRRLAYQAYARALREASDRLALDVSMHGSTEPMHDYHTATPGSFRQTIKGLRNAQGEGVASAVNVVVTRSNFRHLAEIAKVTRAAGALAIRFAPAEAYGSAARAADRVIPAWELLKPYLAEAVIEARRIGLGVLVGDVASSPSVRERFVGIGQVEDLSAEAVARARSTSARAPDAEPPVDDARRLRLAVYGRPRPARQEVRAQVRQTGEDLRAIFPALFEAAGGAG